MGYFGRASVPMPDPSAPVPCCPDAAALAALRDQVDAAANLIDAALARKRACLDDLLDLRNLLVPEQPTARGFVDEAKWRAASGGAG